MKLTLGPHKSLIGEQAYTPTDGKQTYIQTIAFININLKNNNPINCTDYLTSFALQWNSI